MKTVHGDEPGGTLEPLSSVLGNEHLRDLIKTGSHTKDSHLGAEENCPSCKTILTISRSLVNTLAADKKLQKRYHYTPGSATPFHRQVQLWSATAHGRVSELLADVVLDAELNIDRSSSKQSEPSGEKARSAFQSDKTLLTYTLGFTARGLDSDNIPRLHTTTTTDHCTTCKKAKATAGQLSFKFWAGQSSTQLLDRAMLIGAAVDARCRSLHAQQ